MKRFQLTLVFIAFSAITIGAGAFAMNAFTAASSERNLLRLTEDQSERDARFIATLVGQLLTSEAPDEAVAPPVQGAPSDLALSPGFAGATLLIDAPTVLDALDIADIAIYDTSGKRVWSSSIQGTMPALLSEDRLSQSISGESVSGVVKGTFLTSDGSTNDASSDLVYTFIPLIGEVSGETVQVLGVSRPVPIGVASLVESSRDAALQTTLLVLGGVFLVLLAFVLAADIRIWRRNESAIALEREQQTKLGLRNDELRRLSEAKSLFLSEVTHELNNPLASMTGFIGLVLKNVRNNLTVRQVEQLNVVQRNADQMTRLVTDLSDAARIERGQLQTLHEEFECVRVFDDSSLALSHQMKLREQELVKHFNGDLGTMTADRGRLIQVVSNLLSNASKYSPKGATIWLSATVDADSLSVSVRDEGIGIAKEDQANLFTLFYRVNNEETRKVHGTGIGLVLVKEIVEAHGGVISLESEPGEGTIVSFSVPLRPGANIQSVMPKDVRVSDSQEQSAAA